MLQTGDRPHDLQLHIERQRGRNSVRIHLVRGQALGLEKDLMARLAGEPVNLVFNRRAIARADAFDHSRVHRRAIQVGADDIVCPLVGVRNPTRHLPRMLLRRSEKRKHRRRIVLAQLLFARRKIDRAAVDARRCARFKRPCGSCISFNRAASETAAGSPARPAVVFQPIWINPFKNVPAVNTTVEP